MVQTELVKEQMEKGDQSKDPTMKLVGSRRRGVGGRDTGEQVCPSSETRQEATGAYGAAYNSTGLSPGPTPFHFLPPVGGSSETQVTQLAQGSRGPQWEGCVALRLRHLPSQ